MQAGCGVFARFVLYSPHGGFFRPTHAKGGAALNKPYALFDFDGTLIPGDSIVRFCRFARENGFAHAGALLRGAYWAARYYARTATAERAKGEALSFLAGRSVAEVSALSEAFCQKILVPLLRREGVDELKGLADRGLSVLLVTASPEFYLTPLLRRLPLEAIIGTRMHVDENGLYTGRLAGENCRGVQKPLRLAEYLAARGETLDYNASVAFGDSAGDAPMLGPCARKVAVNPRRGLLRRLKNEQGVTVARWRNE